jgi:alkanesulfonate monooxygenase SsuD/methylene tetrahydromethanopterin reductase-like flavin-dependent oxidoreductase (luciferase family)
MSYPFRLGFLTHLEGAGDAHRIYRQTLELFVAADQLGFDVGWVAQHHFKDRTGRLPSPFPFLAAAAERTHRLRLGTSIVVLPLEHPIRVAEDAAVVDTLSNGRLELGIGSGGDAAEFAAFGVDLAQRHQRTTDDLDLLKRTLRGEGLGESDQRLQPPAPTLVDRLWQSALSEAGARFVAQQAAGLMLSRAVWGTDEPTDQAQLPVVNAYLAAWNDQAGAPRIALSRGIYPARDRLTALAELRESVLRSAEGMIKQGLFPPGLALERYCKRMHIAYGHPDEVAAGLRADKVLPYATDLILQFNPAFPPLDQALRMLEQVATQIAPALGWRPAVATNKTIEPGSKPNDH